jgi:hypothetical protein
MYAKDFGADNAGNTNAQTTAALNAAAIAAAAAKKPLVLTPGKVYKTEGTWNLGTSAAPIGIVVIGYGATIEHYPLDDNSDCIAIIGTNSVRTIILGLLIKGQQNGHTFGRCGIRLGKGDYPTIEDVQIENFKQDGFQIRPTVTSHWVENYSLNRVKIQTAGRDGFHFELAGAVTDTFINQGSMDNCETRSIARHTLMLENSTSVSSAQKISCLEVNNMEFGCSPGSEAIIRLKGGAGVATIENINIRGSAVEETSGKRSGWAMECTGKMSGAITLNNNIIFGQQPAKELFINTPCTTNGNITITIDGTGTANVYTVPITTAANTPALVADVIATFDYNNPASTHRCTRSGVQSATFWETDEVQFTFTVDFGTTGVTADIITPGKIKGDRYFPMGWVQDVNSSAPIQLYSSHMPLKERPRTGTLVAATGGAGTGGTADVYVLADGEINEGWVIERYNSSTWKAAFQTFHKTVDTLYAPTNLTVMTAAGQGLFISTACTANGSITVTLDTVNVFVIPLTAVAHYTPDLVADAISRFTFTGYRVLRYNTQSVAFTKADGAAPTIGVTYGTTGAAGSTSAQTLLRIRNDHASSPTDFEVPIRRAVKESNT